MSFKKVLAGILAVTVFTLPVASAHAANLEKLTTAKGNGDVLEAKQVCFHSVTGVVKSIADFRGSDGTKLVTIETEQGEPANLVVSADTYILNSTPITKGSSVTVFYDAHAPRIMIYPPQYPAETIIVNSEKQMPNIKVDVFSRNLVSSDHSLKLNISEQTQIISRNGKAFSGDLADKKLLVVYEQSTKSIPAQTTPIKIVVLEQSSTPSVNAPEMSVVVNNQALKAPAAYLNEQGIVMVPLRSTANALGVAVHWDAGQQKVTVDRNITFTIGQDNYTKAETAVVKLGTAPVLVEGTSYVPLSFFTDVIGISNVEQSGGQILINNR